MFDIANSIVPTQEQILKLQSEMLSMDQVELPTEHYFSGGMYCRKVFRKAGTVIVGKVHKKDHFFMCAQGEIVAWSENGMIKLTSGDIIESKSGTKRVTLALSDAIGITFHKTDKTNLDEIEAELIEPEELALFDSSNKLKKFAIENQKIEILEGSIL
jgi:quercetin dioxygenase-like cupin family protein